MATSRVDSLSGHKLRVTAQSRERHKDGHNSTIQCWWSSTTTHHAQAFWDSLSKHFLTHRALEEFDRRESVQREYHTSRAATASSAPRDLKRFARAGGPDLSDIVGVCILIFSPYLKT